MINTAAAWLVIFVFQFGEPQTHIVEFPNIKACKKAEDKIIDRLYTNDNVATVEAYCLFGDPYTVEQEN